MPTGYMPMNNLIFKHLLEPYGIQLQVTFDDGGMEKVCPGYREGFSSLEGMCHDDGYAVLTIYVNPEPDLSLWPATVAHEAYHAMTAVMTYVGLEETPSRNNEHLAYLLDNIVTKVNKSHELWLQYQ